MIAILVAAVLAADPATPAANPDAAARAAEAAEKAAAAAQTAAEAASRSAASVQQIAERCVAATAAEAATAPPPPRPSPWSASANIGLISLTGNARSITASGSANAERKGERWILGLKATGVYGQSRPADGKTLPEVLAMAATSQVRLDRRFTPRYSAFVLGGLDTDHVKSVEAREYAEGGAGIIWIDEKQGKLQRSFLRTDLAFRYASEARFQYYPTMLDVPDVSLWAPRLGLAFKYAISSDVSFSEDGEILPNVVGPSRLIVNSMSKLSAHLSSSFAVGASFQVAYDSAPATGKVPTDTALTALLEVSL